MSFSLKMGLVLAAALAVAACGRAGPLEPPASPVASANPETKHGLDIHRSPQKITPPDRPFALDPVLQ